MKKPWRMIPKTALLFCNLHDAWVVGSMADPTVTEAGDVDIMVPWSNWPAAAAHIPPDAKPTTLGGWRFMDGKIEVDVWPDTLDRLAAMDFFRGAWHPKTGTRLTRDA